MEGAVKRLLKWIGIGLLVFLGLGIVGSMVPGASEGVPTPTPTKTPVGVVAGAAVAEEATVPQTPATATPAPPTPTPVPGVGVDVQVDEVRWRVLGARGLGSTIQSDNQFIDDATTAGMFVEVRFEVENLGKDRVTLSRPDLVDDQGRSFVYYTNAYWFIVDAEQCSFETLNPNVPKTCTVIYEVPQGATGLMFEADGLAFFGGRTLIDLGLE